MDLSDLPFLHLPFYFSLLHLSFFIPCLIAKSDTEMPASTRRHEEQMAFGRWWSETITPLSDSSITKSLYVSSADQEMECVEAFIHEIDSCTNDLHGIYVC
jgi:hypothetical protein